RFGVLLTTSGHLEGTKCAAAFGVGLTLGDPFAIEIGDLLDQVVVVQDNGPVAPHGERVFVAGDGDARVVGRGFLVGHTDASVHDSCHERSLRRLETSDTVRPPDCGKIHRLSSAGSSRARSTSPSETRSSGVPRPLSITARESHKSITYSWALTRQDDGTVVTKCSTKSLLTTFRLEHNNVGMVVAGRVGTRSVSVCLNQGERR